MNKRKLYILIILVSCIQFINAQTTTVEGYIKDTGTGEFLPFIHVFYKGTQIGTATDTAGYFTITINNNLIKEDSIIISSLGYNSKKVAFTPNQKQKLTIEITAQFYQLQEFVVKPGENPAWAVMRKIIAQKAINNPTSKTNYHSQEYSKIRFDLNHFTDKIKKNIVLRPFDFIWKNTDTTADGVTYLPVLLVEKLIDHYYQKSPLEQKDYVKAINTVGFPGPNIVKFVDDLYFTPNFYDNYVTILNKNFPSPLNDNYKFNYKFYLTDSSGIGETKTYKITFIPKQKRDLAFTGEMYIDSTHYALKEITARFDIMANINFVRSFWVNQKYTYVHQKHWMLSESNVIGDFTVIENSSDLTGFFGRKNATFSNYSIDTVLPKKIFKGVDVIIESDSAKNQSDEFWIKSRGTELSDEDRGLVKMTDSLVKDPRFVLRKKIAAAIASGYYPVGKFDIGDFYSFYSYNNVENSRVKLGFRTNDQLHFPLSFSSYLAYGTLDEQWKYKLSTELTFGKSKHKFGGSYKYDIEQLSRSFNNIELDHILSTFVQIGSSPASKNYVRDFNVYYEHTWTTGFVSRLNYFNNQLSPVNGVVFNKLSSSNAIETVPSYTTSGIDVTIKYSHLNKKANGNFYNKKDNKTVFRKYPEVTFQWKIADKNLGSQLDFQKFKLSFKQQIRLQKLGYLKYYVEAGKTINTVPYQYLDLPYANQLVVMDEYAFNLMNFLEYASDEYVAAHIEHHIEGLLLDRIPLINKLKWRNFIFAKGYYGNLSANNNQKVYLFPNNLNKLKDPYYEVGFGIENIFKIARVDFIWRLTDIEKPNVYYFIVKPSFKFAF